MAQLGQLDRRPELDLRDDLGQARVGNGLAARLQGPCQMFEPGQRQDADQESIPQGIELDQNLLAPDNFRYFAFLVST